MLPHIKYILNDMQTPLLKELNEELDTLGDLCKLVSDSIKEDPPIAMKEGGIIKDGYNAEVDKLRNAKSDGKDWLAKLETEEREKTGIKNLRIKYNKVFGYYLEVTNSFKNLVPDYYTRKQTLANAERTSSRSIPQPLSVIRMNEIPPSLISTTTAVAPASMAFSTSSFTTEAGRSITSPAAILSIVIGSNT
jgi:DNA mismatch repair ATPase MutS